MMKIQRFECNMLAENCYILSDDSAECVIIDCGTYFTEERKALSDYIRNNHLKPVHLLCTHGHLDHVFGNEWIHAEFDLLPEIGRDDDYLITDLRKQARDIFGTEFPLQQLPIGRWLSDGDTITLNGFLLRGREGSILWRHPLPHEHWSHRLRSRLLRANARQSSEVASSAPSRNDRLPWPRSCNEHR